MATGVNNVLLTITESRLGLHNPVTEEVTQRAWSCTLGSCLSRVGTSMAIYAHFGYSTPALLLTRPVGGMAATFSAPTTV